MLTHKGASTLLAIVLLTVTGWMTGSPTFAIASLTLTLIFLIEIGRFSFTLSALRKLRIERNVAKSRLEVGAKTDVALKIVNPTDRATSWLIIQDEVPEAFGTVSGSPRSVLKIKGKEEVTLTYSLVALQMGDYVLGETSVVAVDPWGFAKSMVRLPSTSKLEVYPRLIQMLRAREATQIVPRSSMGQRSVNQPGSGIDFRGIREYSDGDELKHLAWKAVARSPQHMLMTREFDADRSLKLVLALHEKESLLDGAVGRRKVDYAVEAIVALARAATLSGDKAVFVFQNRCHPLAVPGQSRDLQLIRTLKSTYNVRPSKTEKVRELVECLLRDIRQRSLIIVLTDLENDDSSAFEGLSGLLQRHIVRVVIMKTTPLFPRPNIMKPLIKTGYDFLLSHEQRTIKELTHVNSRLGVPLKVCEPSQVLAALSEIYLGAKKLGMTTA